MNRLESIWRYPVSSCAGERLASAEIGASGVVGDRLYGAVDAQRGEIARPGKQPRWDAAPGIAARIVGDATKAQVEIRRADAPAADEHHAPEQPWHPAESAAAQAVLSRHFGFPVELRRHPSPGLSADVATIEPRYLLRHIHLLSLQSMAALRKLVPAAKIDERRFRPNFVVDLAGQPGDFPETRWANGTEFAVGEARLRVVEPCRRCVFITIRHDDMPRDPAILHVLADHNNADLGVVCEVVTPGAVREGDAVRLA